VNRTLYTVAGATSLLFGLLLLVVSISGVFWEATPIADVGMASTVGIFVVFGILGLLLARVAGPGSS